MHAMTAHRIAAICASALAIMIVRSAQPVAACTTPPRGIIASGLIEGAPDARGFIDGAPNPNVLRSGQDILFYVNCPTLLCGQEVTLTLRDQAELDVPFVFEQIMPSEFWRVHPTEPLAPGMYTLIYSGTTSGQRDAEQHTYVFRVEGEATAPTPQLSLEMPDRLVMEPAGTVVWCGVTEDTCRFPIKRLTQYRTFASIHPVAIAPSVTDDQTREFLFRFVRSSDPTDQTTAWLGYGQFSASSKQQYVGAVQTCWIAQSLRLRDGQVTSSDPQCFSYNPDAAPTYPASSTACEKGDITAFTRAWCKDNQDICAPGQPAHLMNGTQTECARYTDTCAPLLGKRAQQQGTCQP